MDSESKNHSLFIRVHSWPTFFRISPRCLRARWRSSTTIARAKRVARGSAGANRASRKKRRDRKKTLTFIFATRKFALRKEVTAPWLRRKLPRRAALRSRRPRSRARSKSSAHAGLRGSSPGTLVCLSHHYPFWALAPN